jgi:nicotinamidase-related amidase
MASTPSAPPGRSIIGNASNFWLHSPKTGFDLTHPATPTSPPIHPRLPLSTTTTPITIDPAKSALVIIDMQNFFLSPCLGRARDTAGLNACSQLLRRAIPAARKAGIRIVWLNWGLTDNEIEDMPPSTLRAFGFEGEGWDGEGVGGQVDDHGVNSGVREIMRMKEGGGGKTEMGKDKRIYRGLGSQIGEVTLDDGSVVDGGRLLMRDQWNAALYPPLDAAYQEGRVLDNGREDVWIHKNRMSGLWGNGTACTEYLEREGIRTLLFAGVNTDQCVGGSLQDAFSKGYDCVLLSDGCGTTSPGFAQDCVEYNGAKTWGFVLGCEELAKGVEGMDR